MRKIYWYLVAYIKKYGVLFTVTLVAAIAIFSVVLPQILQNLESKTTKYVGLIGQYTLQTLPNEISEKISVGLTKIETDNSVSPMLAERWTVEQEGTAYRFLIRENQYWQNGDLLKTDEISYQFPNLETIITKNDIVFKLPAPYSPFPSTVAAPLFKEGQLTRWGIIKKPTLIGLGPYHISDYQLKTNDRFLKEIRLDSAEERLIYRFYMTEKLATEAFKKGEVDVLPDLAQVWPLMQWDNVAITAKINPDQYSAIFFNHTRSFFTKNVRLALAYAITKPAPEYRAFSPISNSSWVSLAGIKTYEKDLDRAVERLLEELPREKLSLTFVTTTLFTPQAETFKNEWEELGRLAVAKCQTDNSIKEKELCNNLAIEINLRISNFPSTSEFDLILIGQTAPKDPDQYELWHSGQPGNFSNYKNTRIDTLLEKGRQTLDASERLAIYQEFQQFIVEDVAAIFLERLPSYQISRK